MAETYRFLMRLPRHLKLCLPLRGVAKRVLRGLPHEMAALGTPLRQ